MRQALFRAVEDDKRSIGAGAVSPDSLGIVPVQAPDIRFFGAGLRAQPSRRVCGIAKPMLYLSRRQRGALYGAKRGHDVGINAVARVGPRFTMGLEPSNILVDAFAHRVRTDHRLAAIATRHIRKPRARRFLRLGKGQDVLAVRISDVVGRSDRPIASTMVRAVVPRDPRPAFGAPPVPDRQALGDGSPVGFTPSLKS